MGRVPDGSRLPRGLAALLGLVAWTGLVAGACGPHQHADTTPRPFPPSDGTDPFRLPLGPEGSPQGEVLLVPGDVLDTRSGERLTLDGLAKRLKSTRVVFLGERHDHLEHHRVQAQLIEALRQGPGKLLVGVEMLERHRETQAVLDAWVRGERTEEQFLEEIGWYQQWGFDFRYYRPVFEAARRHRIPMVALNIQPYFARQMARGGPSALPPAKARLMPPLRLDVPHHETLFRALIGAGPARSPTGRPLAKGAGQERPGQVAPPKHRHPHRGSVENLFKAQVLRDEVMADTVIRRLDEEGPEARMVVLVGGGHLYFGTGVNARLRLSRPQITQATVICHDVPKHGKPVARALGDVLVGTPRPLWRDRFPTLGLRFGDASIEHPGLTVRGVEEGPAKAAGIQVGDQILAMEGRRTTSIFHLRWMLQHRSWGDRVQFLLLRQGRRLWLQATLLPPQPRVRPASGGPRHP